jgi:hypothetical protein
VSKKHQRSPEKRIFAVIILALLFITSSYITLRAYIGNSAEAKKRYETLLAVDAAGGDVEKALFDLRQFVYSHMNTTIGSETGVKPPIQLSGTYKRLVDAEKARVKQANDELYNKAQVDCERRFPAGLSGSNRIPCITEYVTQNAIKEQTIPEGFYKYDFVSPLWSPDLAGFGIIVTAVIGVVLLYQLYSYESSKRHLRTLS